MYNRESIPADPDQAIHGTSNSQTSPLDRGGDTTGHASFRHDGDLTAGSQSELTIELRGTAAVTTLAPCTNK